MTLAELKELVAIDVDATEETLSNLQSLQAQLADREPSVHDQAAFGAYVRDAYTGLENILLRLAKCLKMPIPDSANWHVELTKLFSVSPIAGLPSLFSADLLVQINDYRAFRHIFNKRYTAHLDWAKLQPLVSQPPQTFRAFHARVAELLNELTDQD